MARLKGILPIEGTVGDMTFVKTEDGIILKNKGGVDKSRIETDPAYARLRDHMKEFTGAGKASKLIFRALKSSMYKAADSKVFSRLQKLMMKVVNTDPTNTFGNRNIEDGDLTLLTGFEFNRHSMLDSTFFAPYTTNIDRVTGEAEVVLPAFVPEGSVYMPQGSTHFRVIATGAEIDFAAGTFIVDSEVTAYLPYNNVATAPITLTCALTANTTKRIFLSVGIEFAKEVNGQKYPFNNGSFNGFALVKMDV